MICVAANLRPAITSVGPIIGDIIKDMHLSNSQAGLITTMPLLAFAVFSPIAPKLGRRFGNEKLIAISLLVLAIGIWMRSIPSITLLFIGTAILGGAIAICNVLLPSFIKQHFSKHVGIMTSIYTTVMGMFASIASGISISLEKSSSSGWEGGLTTWGILVIVTLVIWIPQLRNTVKIQNSKKSTVKTAGVWSSAVAWKVTFFMGLQSLAFYVTVAWLPEILHSKGFDISTAAGLVSLMGFVGLPATFIVPVLAYRFANQKMFVVGICVLYIIGLVGVLNPSTVFTVIGVICMGLGQGASISLSYAFIGLRTRNAEQAAELSGMAQSIGYLLAAVGPILFGYLRDASGSWTISVIGLIIVCICMLPVGLGAAKNSYVTSNNIEKEDF
ncbi:cyanate transporter [Bacillus cereus VD133]|uniref:Cyanate transporter n=1 Tax=Bacillus cereus VD133 TaxID=1053233 RepID=A0A9W5UZ33_BACCE|nr:MFS transporter [Bacillus cereus]EOO24347.1 cyanate transporter [Bacillus cereus VD133]